MDLRVIDWEGVDWIHIAQDKDQWWVLVRWWTFGFHKRQGFSLPAEWLLASQERLYSM